ncbi:hypothetical protein TTHERM_000724752 (macronuclear) [Tetrahymena thermophila SB210]|uniref:Uncharacterized protein n=1 Tax=Tetrahymena thermophila (strain SB210) TaxID=312017 RepID=W7WWE6_TETTS|nr:hypothetical protein TTHERM_000724752 [Tetrahymena thermophila SB210]EWS71155.1 hypothetical protein TTHERM_000724752 [Tetrahymena thermophila SB210]|eukprot:XP_012656296.1 hypothetical protein TTHERM_000724752 [Tetrahymena thermophila SB210]
MNLQLIFVYNFINLNNKQHQLKQKEKQAHRQNLQTQNLKLTQKSYFADLDSQEVNSHYYLSALTLFTDQQNFKQFSYFLQKN